MMWSSKAYAVVKEQIPLYELAPPGQGDVAGFNTWDFHYHEGYGVAPDGRRVDISFKHRHSHFEIFWIRQGRGMLARDCEHIEVRPHSLIIVGPGDVHCWAETEHVEGSCLSVSEVFTSTSNFSLPFSQLTSFLQPNGSRAMRLSPTEDALIRNIFEIIRDSQVQANFDRREVLKALLLILFSKIHGFYAGQGAPPAVVADSPLTREFKQALIAECPRLVSVKEFAQHLKVSRSYLHRAVLQDTGRNPSDLIRDRLIFEAKRLLLHTAQTQAEIAGRLGFRTPAYFASFFRRHTELSPKEFRSGRAA
jgi:AraC-like DNA-binding protein/mannose-6-phosphate isomerase-like protein (cupin superfamily)